MTQSPGLTRRAPPDRHPAPETQRAGAVIPRDDDPGRGTARPLPSDGRWVLCDDGGMRMIPRFAAASIAEHSIERPDHGERSHDLHRSAERSPVRRSVRARLLHRTSVMCTTSTRTSHPSSSQTSATVPSASSVTSSGTTTGTPPGRARPACGTRRCPPRARSRARRRRPPAGTAAAPPGTSAARPTSRSRTGRSACGWPMRRTQRRAHEHLERHLRADRVARQRHHRARPPRSSTRPAPCGPPGCIATLTNSTPAPGERVLDHLVRPRADPAGGEDEVDAVARAARAGPRRNCSTSSGTNAQQLRDAARVVDGGGEHRRRCDS